MRVGPLSLTAARDAFVALAGERLRNDPDLDRLLEAVDRIALAVTLLGCQAESDRDLSGLWARWQKKRTELLRRGDGKSRLTNLEVSIEMSIQSPRMTEPGRRLLSLLGILPDGIAAQDLPELILEDAEAASSVLRKIGLAFSQGPRLRVLSPVREHAWRRHPPSDEDLDRAILVIRRRQGSFSRRHWVSIHGFKNPIQWAGATSSLLGSQSDRRNDKIISTRPGRHGRASNDRISSPGWIENSDLLTPTLKIDYDVCRYS